ncbi:MAG TPA: 4Fe-4S binding protein [Polyangiaceae bacterium LLY-WYZ-15_(1-7)]|nr:4Fe-4S ferredoxin [Myxococcales bacterium]MAT24560.1 4Fe-4S ferredoxin [Sandaracinus sp.]HJK89697.1 4Fe-4S binding protein [Polyangiaceae bacterium LLY-WYZ-15_(1-7)]MBJ71850.1 4Fe-4S ferredoxin [Sandaracinus sp.]HJL03607.1 4Fe-4S binding protein [Polyangiaceae bacterium LLY-WYZ-15_(1-7)]
MDLQGQNGLMTTFREGWRSRKASAWLIALALLAFYTDLYFFDHLTEPAKALGLRSKWFLYSALYSVAMIGGAVYYLRRHGNARYNRYRIATNLGVQLVLAFLLPFVMPLLAGAPEDDYWKYEYFAASIWPLDHYKLHPSILRAVPLVLALTTVALAFLVAPLLGFFFGKRWYCSWVCGCGGLANTFGDPWRHLTATSTASWKFEKVAVHSVMFLAIVSTLLLFVDAFADTGETFHAVIAGGEWWSMKSLYGYVVGALLAGLVGVGFYPLFGPRVWCRNFCPMAALLGLTQKLGRFRIRVKPDMCISCGNCTTYCEMGIDVRSYAQSNESFTRAACVGCGMCAHVCPRGVLKLENAPTLQEDKARQRLPVVNL